MASRGIGKSSLGKMRKRKGEGVIIAGWLIHECNRRSVDRLGCMVVAHSSLL